MKNVRLAILVLLSSLLALSLLSERNVFAETPYSVDFAQKIGPIKKLNGANIWAPLYNSRNAQTQDAAVGCHFSTIRLHDIPLDNGGMRLVDVQHIFGNEDADPQDPKNYYFTQTDDYIRRIVEGGSMPVYRLGTSIEHSANSYYARRPKDPEHYAEICAGIVRHYNEGWADGFHWNIAYWEIWNEPDLVPQMWDDKDWNTYCEFYVVVAKRLRAEFPDIKIGGPAITGAKLPLIRQLAQACKEAGAPLDFVSWHCYPKKPEQLLDPPAQVRKALDEIGFPNAELHLNEWHYLPCGFDGLSKSLEDRIRWHEAPDGLHGYVSAAFNDYVLTRWQDTPLTMSNYYTYNSKAWGTHDYYGRTRTTYYSLRLFGELVAYSPERVKTTDAGGPVALLGGVDEGDNVKRLLVSIFKLEDAAPIEIALAGVPASGKIRISKIDADGFQEYEAEYADSVLKLDAKDSGVYFVRF